jgi:hypothetical protein
VFVIEYRREQEMVELHALIGRPPVAFDMHQ